MFLNMLTLASEVICFIERQCGRILLCRQHYKLYEDMIRTFIFSYQYIRVQNLFFKKYRPCFKKVSFATKKCPKFSPIHDNNSIALPSIFIPRTVEQLKSDLYINKSQSVVLRVDLFSLEGSLLNNLLLYCEEGVTQILV